ncbi:MAG: hypothetical protein OXR72_16035 [Gemmatimonadota bacterium]|nr:hypothetical protein [Gemmatimonadota bacterium]
MICRIVQLFLPLYVENDLTVSMASRISRHLGHCNGCMAVHQSFVESQRIVRKFALTVSAPALSERMVERIRHDILKASPQTGPVKRQANRKRNLQWIVTWSAAAVLVIAGIGLLIRNGTENGDSHLARSSENNAESLIDPYEPEFRESGQSSRAEVKALIRRLNPRPHLTDEELDAEYPTLVSVNQPDGVPVIYRTNDPTTTIVWVLPRKGANHQ